MKAPHFALIVAGIIAMTVIVGHHSTAQPTNSAADRGTLGEFEQLVFVLSKSEDTNAVKQFTDFTSHVSAQECATEAAFDTRILSDLRSGKTNEAMELLESRLDGAVTGFADPSLGKRYPQYDKILEQVKKYRAKYPHSSKSPEIDADVARTLDSVPK